jgi:hypothetical protein
MSALRASAGPGWRRYDDAGPIEIGIDRTRSIKPIPGYRLRWLTDLQQRTVWSASPPRVRPEHAVIDVVARAQGDWETIALLADICQSRHTTANRIIEALECRTRLRRRPWLVDVLTDISGGSCSGTDT